MTKVIEIARYIEKLCPLNLACEWDNVGLLVGDENADVSKVLICLDNDENVTSEAIELGADMIISHHPIMFSPINRLTEDNPQQRMIRRMCENGICHYAAHTNMDCAIGGLNDYLTSVLGFSNAEIFEKTSDNAGFGRYVELAEEKTLSEIITLCKQKLNLPLVSYVGQMDKKIKTIVVNSGSGSSALDKCIAEKVDLLITGDIKYNVARDAAENNVALIDAGHYGTEIVFTSLVKDYLEKEFGDVEFVISKANVSTIKMA